MYISIDLRDQILSDQWRLRPNWTEFSQYERITFSWGGLNIYLKQILHWICPRDKFFWLQNSLTCSLDLQSACYQITWPPDRSEGSNSSFWKVFSSFGSHTNWTVLYSWFQIPGKSLAHSRIGSCRMWFCFQAYNESPLFLISVQWILLRLRWSCPEDCKWIFSPKEELEYFYLDLHTRL